MDMNRLYGLLEAKNRYDEAKAKAEAKIEQSLNSNKTST
jgi:hypothetical protein